MEWYQIFAALVAVAIALWYLTIDDDDMGSGGSAVLIEDVEYFEPRLVAGFHNPKPATV